MLLKSFEDSLNHMV